jgi:glycosyltransferase involved in cell wall biosynthesis
MDGRIFHKQAKTLAKAGYDVALIAQHHESETVEGIKIIALARPSNRFTRISGLAWRAFRLALRQHADVYHFHDPELLPFGVLLKWLTRAKIVYDVHENVRQQIRSKAWLPMWSRRLLSVSYVLVEGICLLFIDRVVLAEDSYLENYRRRRDAVAIRNYPLLSLSKPRARTGDDGQEGPDRGFRVVYVGGITGSRGAVQLVEALKIVRADGHAGVTLSLVGTVISAELKTKLNALIRQYDLADSCLIPGPVPHEEVFDLLARAHVGVAVLHPEPNYTGSLPTKLFEYMAAGLPVVASNFPLWKEIVEGNECGLTVNPLNLQEIARAIEYLLTHPEEAKRMGENGRRAVSEKFNWEKEGERLLTLYEELLGETR